MLKALGVAGVAAVGAAATGARRAETGLTTVATFDPPQLPENIAVTGDGTHYLSMAPTGEIWALTPGDDAAPESVASLPLPEDNPDATLLGVVPAEDEGALYACLNSRDPETHGVWRVPLDDGEPTLVAGTDPEETTVNGITTALGEGTLLVTDHQRGVVWRVTDEGDGGDAEVWLDSRLLVPSPYAALPVGVDGIAVGPDGDVWLDNLSFGSVLRVPVEGDSPGEPEVVAHTDALVGADGLTVDANGDVYVAVNLRNEVVRLPPEGEPEPETVVAGEILDFPSDVHFGTGGSERTLYFTNFAFGSARAEGQQADPSYMSVDLGTAEGTATPAGNASGD